MIDGCLVCSHEIKLPGLLVVHGIGRDFGSQVPNVDARGCPTEPSHE
jgi:hypothetical protein